MERMSSRKYQPPHHTLGKYLKTIRQRQQETLGETSGAVEIDVEMLDRIERGDELPPEDILLLLISHFNVQEDDAAELWEMAGYAPPESDQPQYNQPRPAMLIVAADTRILYSNSAQIVSDDAGLTISFGQTMDGSQSALPVSRIGMSYEQAEKLLETLQRVMLRRRYGDGGRLLGDGN